MIPPSACNRSTCICSIAWRTRTCIAAMARMRSKLLTRASWLRSGAAVGSATPACPSTVTAMVSVQPPQQLSRASVRAVRVHELPDRGLQRVEVGAQPVDLLPRVAIIDADREWRVDEIRQCGQARDEQRQAAREQLQRLVGERDGVDLEVEGTVRDVRREDAIEGERVQCRAVAKLDV